MVGGLGGGPAYLGTDPNNTEGPAHNSNYAKSLGRKIGRAHV